MFSQKMLQTLIVIIGLLVIFSLSICAGQDALLYVEDGNLESNSGPFQCNATKEIENITQRVEFSSIPPPVFRVTIRDGIAVCETLENVDLQCSVKEPAVNGNDIDGTLVPVYYCKYCVTDAIFTNHPQEKELLGKECRKPNHFYMYDNKGNFGCFPCCQNYSFSRLYKKCLACPPGQGTRGIGVYSYCLGLIEIDPIPTVAPNDPTVAPTKHVTNTPGTPTTKSPTLTPTSSSANESETPPVKTVTVLKAPEKPRVCQPTNLAVNGTPKAHNVSLIWNCTGGTSAETFSVTVRSLGEVAVEMEVKELHVEMSQLIPGTRYEATIATTDDKGKRWSDVAEFITMKKPPSLAVDGFQVHSVENWVTAAWKSIDSWPADEEPYLGYKIRYWKEKHSNFTEIHVTGDTQIWLSILEPGRYFVYILAYSNAGDGPPSHPRNMLISTQNNKVWLIVIAVVAGSLLLFFVGWVIYKACQAEANGREDNQGEVPEDDDRLSVQSLISVNDDVEPPEG